MRAMTDTDLRSERRRRTAHLRALAAADAQREAQRAAWVADDRARTAVLAARAARAGR